MKLEIELSETELRELKDYLDGAFEFYWCHYPTVRKFKDQLAKEIESLDNNNNNNNIKYR